MILKVTDAAKWYNAAGLLKFGMKIDVGDFWKFLLYVYVTTELYTFLLQVHLSYSNGTKLSPFITGEQTKLEFSNLLSVSELGC